MVDMPPVAEHEFTRRFYACHQSRPSLHWYHRCKKIGSRSHDLLKLLPKKITELEVGGDQREVFWGLYARERPGLRWILVYNLVCLLPMLVYFLVWISPLGRATDLQNPSVPISIMVALLSLFWSIFLGCLQFGENK